MFESARLMHEEIETLERVSMEVLEHKPRGSKAKVSKEHVVSNLVGGISERSTALESLHVDRDGTLKDEISMMRGANVFTNFYSALKETREYHARHGDRLQRRLAAEQASAAGGGGADGDDANATTDNVAEAVKVATDGLSQSLVSLASVSVEFSGEELWGKYVDLTPQHLAWCNGSFGSQCDYTEVRASFPPLRSQQNHLLSTRDRSIRSIRSSARVCVCVCLFARV
jgi:splicing factor 3A subunit 3